VRRQQAEVFRIERIGDFGERRSGIAAGDEELPSGRRIGPAPDVGPDRAADVTRGQVRKQLDVAAFEGLDPAIFTWYHATGQALVRGGL
jgi:hypothetical protein